MSVIPTHILKDLFYDMYRFNRQQTNAYLSTFTVADRL